MSSSPPIAVLAPEADGGGRVTTAGAAPTGSPVAPPAPEAGGRARAGLWALPLYLVLQLVLLAGLRAFVPRFFWVDDAQIQFTPMHWWLGQRLADGSVPLLDPDQGMAGNLTADMQNGVLDVIRWPFLLWAGGQQDLLLVATVHGWLSVLVLGSASVALLLNHGVRPALAVAGALGVSTSGFFLWWGSAWSPSMWSLAALVWLWAALSSPRWYGVVGVALASAAVVCAGNPYILPLVAVLLAGQVLERWQASGRGLFAERRTWATLLALLAGAALSVPTVVNALDVAQWMWRPEATETLASRGDATNVLDVVLGGTTLMYEFNVPLLSTLVIALPLLALVDWPRAVRRPGVVTALALCVASVLWTQLPFYFLSFRGPFRLLSGVQVGFGLLAVLAVTAAMRLSRRRLAVAAGLLVLQIVVASMRAPVLWRWHVLGLVLAVTAFVGAVVLVRSSAHRPPLSWRWVRPAAAATTILLCASPFVVQLAMQASVQERHEALDLGADEPGVPVYRPNTNGYSVGTTVDEFRENAYVTDTSLTAYAFGAFADPDDRGWQRGVLGGNLNLLAGLRPGYGSLAVWPAGAQQHLQADWQSSLVSDQSGLLVVPEGSDVPWVDLLSSDRVLLGVEGSVPQPIADHFAQGWTAVSSRDGWTEYVRPQPLPGRVSMVTGDDVTVEDAAANDGVATLGAPLERYTVSTGDDGGRLVFRTPYWNGFHATVDGRPVEVSAYGDALLQVQLPAGVSDGTLEVSFEPLGARLLPGCAGLGALLLAASVVPAVRSRRERDTTARH
ncbi:YfhO family protein [Geodermatophilus poikilotrophus]|uniref:Membrane protein YfhO n=1 Tax=Geodermatophilus poikilotrophus TaxID=1333667 RepID=A0A1I0H2R4_9ACTN|nr:YfhO family protein [Geodermatophilus poikilotrophus]SET77779.1 hypothetical protein SAMN04488546_3565 [Geodermatophilus poikilotrophus]